MVHHQVKRERGRERGVIPPVAICRFCRLSKKMKKKEREAQEEQEEAQSTNQAVTMRSFEKLWCEGWDSPCVETSVSFTKSVRSFLTPHLLQECDENQVEVEDG